MTPPKRFPDRDEIAAVRAGGRGPRAGGGVAREAAPRRPGHGAARAWASSASSTSSTARGASSFCATRAGSGEVDVDLGDVVGVVGSPANSRRGEPSLAVGRAHRAARRTGARFPTPSTGVTDQETRYRKRYLDLLMNEDSRELFLLRRASSRRSGGSSTRTASSRSRRRSSSPATAGRSRTRSSRTRSELDADLYLRIATELYLKRLIVGGLERVYEIGKDFRNESVSYKHQPEFTMLEWYEAYADYHDTMARIEALVEQVALEVLGYGSGHVQGGRDRAREALARAFASSTLSRSWSCGRATPDELRAWLEERGVDTKADKDWPQLVDHAFSHFVEPGLVQPTIVHDYPIELSPFARLTDDDPR